MARLIGLRSEHWGVIPGKELETLLRAAHDLPIEKLPQKTKDSLLCRAAELQKLVSAKRKALAEKAKREAAAKEAAPPRKKKAAKKKSAK